MAFIHSLWTHERCKKRGKKCNLLFFSHFDESWEGISSFYYNYCIMRSQGISLGTLWASKIHSNYTILMRIESASRLKQILTCTPWRLEMNQFVIPQSSHLNSQKLTNRVFSYFPHFVFKSQIGFFADNINNKDKKMKKWMWVVDQRYNTDLLLFPSSYNFLLFFPNIYFSLSCCLRLSNFHFH